MATTTALAITEPNNSSSAETLRADLTVLKESFMTLQPAEMDTDQLADIVIEGFKKLRSRMLYIVELKHRFDDGERDSANRLRAPIKGCYSWREFCAIRLDRTPQTVGDLLIESKGISSVCSLCGESFPSKAKLKKHAYKKHPRAGAPRPTPTSEVTLDTSVDVEPVSFIEPAEPINAPSPLSGDTGKEGISVQAETHWVSKENRCPTGRRGFDCPDDIWQLMRAEGKIEETDFVAYIGKCRWCGKCHRDGDQSGHKEGDNNLRNQTWYRPEQEGSPTMRLRKRFAAHYKKFALKPNGTGGYDVEVFGLSENQVLAIGELLGMGQ